MSENPMAAPDPKAPRYNARGQVLCTARKRGTQELCGQAASPGQRVCRFHGGASPQAKNKARLRLAELVAPAIATLAREMAQATSSSDRMKAANSILDRAGWGRVSKVEAADAREVLVTRLLEMQQEAAEDLADELIDAAALQDNKETGDDQG